MAVRLSASQARKYLTPKKRAARAPRPKLAASWAVELTLPVCVVSEMNRRDHWAVRKRRFDVQHRTLWAVLAEGNFLGGLWIKPSPVQVTFAHVGRRMDTDNLAGAFKGLRDSLARWLGVDDGDEAVTWVYQQVPGTPGGVRVRIEGA